MRFHRHLEWSEHTSWRNLFPGIFYAFQSDEPWFWKYPRRPWGRGCTWCWPGSFLGLSLGTKEERLLEQGWTYHFGLQGQETPSVLSLGELSYEQANVWDHTSFWGSYYNRSRSAKRETVKLFVVLYGLIPSRRSPITRAVTSVIQNVSPLACYPLLHTIEACARFARVHVTPSALSLATQNCLRSEW